MGVIVSEKDKSKIRYLVSQWRKTTNPIGMIEKFLSNELGYEVNEEEIYFARNCIQTELQAIGL